MPPLDGSAAYEAMSPSLLAQQPLTLPNQDANPGKDWGEIYGYLEARLSSLKNWRYSWWSFWATLALYILPERYRWLVTANTMDRGRQLNDAIVDGTATQAMEICASGLWTGLTSPSRPWVKLGIALPWIEIDADGKAWMEDTEQRLYAVLAGSNFYPEMAQSFRDVATFGTSPIIVYEDAEDVIRLYLPCAGEYYLAVGSRLTVDTQYREFTYTVQQIVEMFTLENCPPEIRQAWANGGASLDQEFVVAHAIEPNFAIQGKSGKKVTVVPGSFPFREVYWIRGLRSNSELSRRGFSEKPIFVSRWSKVSNDPYGRSPGMKAIGDTKQLQLETRRKAEFIEKLVRPPMLADPELKNEPSSIIPGNVTYVNTANGKKGFAPAFEVNAAALAPMVQDLDKIEARIKEWFFVPLFMAITQMEGVQPRNELELTKRDLERLQVLGPFINLFESEVAAPMLQRILAIMQRRKLLKPMPPSLKGVPLKFEFISIMRMAQRSTESVAMKDFFSVAGELSEAAKAAGLPDPLRKVNLEKSLERYADISTF